MSKKRKEGPYERHQREIEERREKLVEKLTSCKRAVCNLLTSSSYYQLHIDEMDYIKAMRQKLSDMIHKYELPDEVEVEVNIKEVKVAAI